MGRLKVFYSLSSKKLIFFMDRNEPVRLASHIARWTSMSVELAISSIYATDAPGELDPKLMRSYKHLLLILSFEEVKF